MLLLLGDWNIDVAPWTNPSISLSDYQKEKAPLLTALREMASECGLELLVTRPTRRQGATRASTLDVVFTNQPKHILETNLLPSSSDHMVVVVEKVIKTKVETPKPFFKRSFKNYSKEKMCQEINPQMLDSLLDSSDIELVANVLICHITEGIEKLAPIIRIQPRANYAPYLSTTTKEKMGQRDKLKWKALESRDPDDWKAFKTVKNQTLKQQRKEKFEWANKLIGEDPQDGKKIWSAVDKICKSKKNMFVDKLVIDGVITMDKGKMANGLNNFFVSKVAKLVKEIPIPATELLAELTNQSPVNVPQMELN